MSPFIRKVRTASGAWAVQVVTKVGRRNRVLKHVGSAHTREELGLLMGQARQELNPGQQVFDFESLGVASSSAGLVLGLGNVRCGLLWRVLKRAYCELGFDGLGDEAFMEMVLARLIEPTSKAGSARVLKDIGIKACHRNTYYAALGRCVRDDYRDKLARLLFSAAVTGGDLSLVLYDVTTLYFEAEKEDDPGGVNQGLRRVGYSKERRVDPQIVVGLLVDRSGFPLEITCWEGNKAETRTLLPTIKAFQDRHNIHDFVVVADAGMLSAANLKTLNAQGIRFIVGARQTRAPHDLENFFHWHGDALKDGQVIETITPRHKASKGLNPSHEDTQPSWDPSSEIGAKSWRAIWCYTTKRAKRDQQTLNSQHARAQAILGGKIKPKTARFITTTTSGRVFNETAYQQAQRLVGLKGYVTNIPAQTMDAHEIITSYHELWHVEQSFRMSKTDLKARPIFHHTKQAIQAHLTVVIAALAISRYLQAKTGITTKRLIQTLRPIIEAEITLPSGQTITRATPTPNHTQNILTQLGH